MTKERITIDLSDCPDVFSRLKASALSEARSLAAQLKYECLPVLLRSSTPPPARVKKGGRK